MVVVATGCFDTNASNRVRTCSSMNTFGIYTRRSIVFSFDSHIFLLIVGPHRQKQNMPRDSPDSYPPRETVIYRRNFIYDIDLNCDSSDVLVNIKILKRTGLSPSLTGYF